MFICVSCADIYEQTDESQGDYEKYLIFSLKQQISYILSTN